MARRYDKGDRRFKHVGRTTRPEFELQSGHHQRWIGKCPANLSPNVINGLLDDALALPGSDRELAVPKRLYAIHEGAIYEAQTSDGGVSYHGYPYRGSLPVRLVSALRNMAQIKGCLEDFEDWVKRYIVIHGSYR